MIRRWHLGNGDGKPPAPGNRATAGLQPECRFRGRRAGGVDPSVTLHRESACLLSLRLRPEGGSRVLFARAEPEAAVETQGAPVGAVAVQDEGAGRLSVLVAELLQAAQDQVSSQSLAAPSGEDRQLIDEEPVPE